MADKKISELTELTTPDGTEELVVNDSGTSKKITQTNLLSTALPLAGGTMTGDVSLGDNVKAKFGAGNDLQIYHDGSNSYINENGTGSLYLKATNLTLGDSAGEQYVVAYSGGSVNLYNNNAEKLATTSTGIDVTGSVTCDGANVGGGLLISNSAASYWTLDRDDTDGSLTFTDSYINEAMRIDNLGNVGIGTSSPDAKLTIDGFNTFPEMSFKAGNQSSRKLTVGMDNSTEHYISAVGSETKLLFKTQGSEKMRIDSSGNVKVNTGNLVIGTSGKGIDFSAATPDGTGTTGSEVLDDYETGTWTPTVVGLTLTSPVGYYTKVGRLVTVNWLFVYPTTSSSSQTSIAGLPFTVGAGYTNGGNHGYVNGSAAVSIAHITAVTTSLLYRTANGGVSLTHADLSGATIRGSMTYQV